MAQHGWRDAQRCSGWCLVRQHGLWGASSGCQLGWPGAGIFNQPGSLPPCPACPCWAPGSCWRLWGTCCPLTVVRCITRSPTCSPPRQSHQSDSSIGPCAVCSGRGSHWGSSLAPAEGPTLSGGSWVSGEASCPTARLSEMMKSPGCHCGARRQGRGRGHQRPRHMHCNIDILTHSASLKAPQQAGRWQQAAAHLV